MKAAVQKGVGVLKVEEVPEPKPAPDQVKVKIAYCGICGTDIEILEERFGLAKAEADKRPKGPNINGHEASGTIVELGSQVQGYKVGQRVALNFKCPCGGCYYCRNKMEHFCTNIAFATGAFAEYAVYKEELVYPLPDGISLEHGALLEPVSVAVHAVDLSNTHPGSTVAISGAGAIGLLMLEMVQKAGATKVMVSEPVAEKRQLALKLGADVAVDPLKEDLDAVGKQFTNGLGFDVVIEASGNLRAAKQAVSLAGRCGTVLWAAVYPEDAEIALKPFHMYANELTIRSVFCSPYCFPRALDLLPKLKLDTIISDIIPLQDIEKAFELHKKGKSIKILIKP
jgi:2-desacetyl-2-hydroxyethyl bacteriochlorophyllide A dehydrogenase